MPPAAPPAPPLSDHWVRAMQLALDQARLAASHGETPVGAVVLSPDNQILAQAANSPITLNDPSAHAEILALRAAGTALSNYRLPGCILVCTLEPCLMCAAAAVHARIAGIVYGAPDPKTGAVSSRLATPDLDFVNHRFWHIPGVLADQSSQLLKDFFQAKRR